MKGRQQPKTSPRNPTEFRTGVKALAEEVQGVIKIVTIRPKDFAIMLGEAVAGHSGNLDLLETVADLIGRVGRAPKSAPMLCAACPAPLAGGYSVVIATAANVMPKHGLGMGVCPACGPTLDAIEAAALKGLRGIWPDLRRLSVHYEAGHA